jgi:hypothetical protein
MKTEPYDLQNIRTHFDIPITFLFYLTFMHLRFNLHNIFNSRGSQAVKVHFIAINVKMLNTILIEFN